MISTIPPLASFIGDPKFLQVHQDSEHFSWWTENNLTTLKSLMIDSVFTSFAALKEKYKTPNGELRRFLQIRHFYNTYFQAASTISYTFYENICANSPRAVGLISEIYSNLTNTNNPDKHPQMIKWEQELDIKLSTENWSNCISILLKCTRSITIRETEVKLFTRWYYTPAKLHTIFPTIHHTCFKGCITTGSFTHIFWDCEKVSQIWKQLENFASII